MEKNEKALKAKKKEELINIIIRKDNVESKLLKEISDLKQNLHDADLKYDALQDYATGNEEALFKYYKKLRIWRIIGIVSWITLLAAGIVYAILAA